MARKKRSFRLSGAALSMLSMVAAVVGVLLVYKYSGREPAYERPPAPALPDTTAFVVRDSTFSLALEREVLDALGELGLWDDLIWMPADPAGAATTLREIRVRVPSDLALVHCNLELSRRVERLGGQVLEALEYPARREVVMTVGEDEQATHRIYLRRYADLIRRTGRIALVLDDFGYRGTRLTEQFCAIPQSITLSVFPHLKASQETIALVRRSGHEAMIHLPMEPRDARSDLGDGMIMVSHSDDEIRTITRRAIQAMPGVVGVNNHMGSKATEDRRVMEIVLGEIRRAGLLFVDSRTSSQSIAYQVAGEMKVPRTKTTMFIDNEDAPEAIEKRLLELAERAVHNGYAVGIGHGRSNTLHTLQRVLPRLEKRGFQFVPVSKLAHVN